MKKAYKIQHFAPDAGV